MTTLRWQSTLQVPPPAEADLAALADTAPPMRGGEYLNAEVLARLWRGLDELVRVEIAKHPQGAGAWLKESHPLWRMVGRVTFHLAENKRHPTHPFAFMASYASRISSQSRVQHLPLGRALQDHGLELTSAVDRLNAFNAVQNTYLNTFQMLGALGLLLGSVGLGVVVLRNVLERRGELAVLLAVGFRPRVLRRLVIWEHGALQALGLLLGMVAAWVAVLPVLLSPGASISFGPMVAAIAFLETGGPSRIVAALSRPSEAVGGLLAQVVQDLLAGVQVAVAVAVPFLVASVFFDVVTNLIARTVQATSLQSLWAPLRALFFLLLLAAMLDRILALIILLAARAG